jgi:GPH family glycoside/pentoside/hexuronide:cation symporter
MNSTTTEALAMTVPAEMMSNLPVGPQAAYGVGQIAGQIFRDVPSLLLLFFMTNVLGIQPALAGIAIFVPKLVWGMTCDISVGLVSDKIQKRMARKWWLIIGAVAAPISMILLFHVPVLSANGRAIYVACVFSLYMLAFATFSVPYLAIAGELSSSPHQRTKIMAWRLVFTAIGVLIADSLAPVFIQTQGGGQIAYEHTSILLAATCTTALLIAFFGAGAVIRRAPAVLEMANPVKLTVRGALAALAERRFSVLLVSNLFLLIAGGMGYASMLYFLTYNMHRQDAFTQIGIITLLASATIIISQPGWVYLARKFGKKSVFVGAGLFYGAVLAAWSFLGPLGLGISYGFALLLGVSNSGWTLLGYSMVADITGDGKAGLYSAVWIAADKIGFALGGTLLVGLVLSSFGFDASRAMAGLAQAPSALTGVKLAFGVLPGCLSVVSAGIFAIWGVSKANAI